LELDVVDPVGEEQEVERPVAHDLIREVKVTCPGELGLDGHHPRA